MQLITPVAVSHRCILSSVMTDDFGSPGMAAGPFSDVVDLVVDDQPLVGALVMLLHLLPGEGLVSHTDRVRSFAHLERPLHT
mgnify:CR=1 FL=1